ncbi:MAG: GyrI-like domain-containing protein [Candidatus Brocadiia bacterium]
MAEVQLKELRSLTVMSRSFTGSYSQTGDQLDELMAWLLRAGHPYSEPPRTIFYDDPEEVPEEDLRAEVCLPIEEECEARDEVERKRLEAGTFACLMHEGAYEGIRDKYEQIFDWIDENGYEYIKEMGVREVLHTIIGETQEQEELLTEIRVPVRETETGEETDEEEAE